jgi:succinyl-diaminopimelate desuccinylase
VAPSTLRSGLVERLIEHCAVLSVTGEERALADAVEQRYRRADEPVVRVGDSLVIGAPQPGRPTVLLVGHLDVVPPTDADDTPHVATLDDGTDIVIGRGTSDMKSGNVVAMSLFEDAELRAASPWSICLVLYAGEEGPAAGNELSAVLDAVPWLTDAALAVVLEPTDGRVELGCLGGLHATVTFQGAAAHSARPWQGRNALTAGGELLVALEARAPSACVVDGIDFRDVLVATQAWTGGLGPEERGGSPRNVVPDRFTVNVNLRFAPSRDLATAERELIEEIVALSGTDADITVEIVDRVPPAPPHRDLPAVAAFVTAVGATIAGKQAWTDVARFAERGVPALNFGPGATAQAHQRGEWVSVDAMVDARERLAAFLAGGTTCGGGGAPPPSPPHDRAALWSSSMCSGPSPSRRGRSNVVSHACSPSMTRSAHSPSPTRARHARSPRESAEDGRSRASISGTPPQRSPISTWSGARSCTGPRRGRRGSRGPPDPSWCWRPRSSPPVRPPATCSRQEWTRSRSSSRATRSDATATRTWPAPS